MKQKDTSVVDPKPELVIHVGPPKTATTSLQVALAKIRLSDIDFLGAYQPRELNGDTKCHVVNDWCKDPTLAGSARVQDFVERVESNTQNGITSIIVEEVLLDSSQHIRWDRKIRNLGRFVAPYGAVPALTLRDPVDGVFSLQREFSSTLGVLARHSVFFFIRFHQCQVFDYRHLLKTLQQAGFSSVYLFLFDSLIQDGFDLGGMTGRVGDDSVLRLDNMNASNAERKRSSLVDRIVRVMIRKWIDDYMILKARISACKNTSPLLIDDLLTALEQPIRTADRI